MKTKTFLSAFAAIAAATFCSCKRTSPDFVSEKTPEGQAELKVSIVTNASKVYTRSDEQDKAIDSIAIMVYNESDALENLYFGSVDNLGKVDASIRTSMGKKTVVAFANGSTAFRNSLKEKEYLEDLESLTSDLNADNDSTLFLMKGRADNVNVNASSFNLELEMSRLVARIELHKIKHAISPSTDNLTAQKRFMVSSIYLINVAGQYSFGGSDPQTWYNKLGCYSGDQHLYGDIALDQVLEYGESYDQPHYFYAYPNSCNNFDCTDSEWSPRPTRLVIECWVGEEGCEDICYYAFNIPDGKNPDIQSLSGNTTYSITSCTITRYGSETPYEDIPVGSAAIKVSVKDWQTGESYEYTI